MKKLFIMMLSVLPALGMAQSTYTFWENGCEDLSEWTNNGTGNWAIEAYPHTGTNSIATAGGSDYANSTSYIVTSGDGGSSWSKLYNAQLSHPYDGKLPSGNILGTNLAWYNNIASWQQIVVDLSDFEGSDDFMFRITFGSDGGTIDWGMNVDDFAIYGYAKTTIHNHSTSTDQ